MLRPQQCTSGVFIVIMAITSSSVQRLKQLKSPQSMITVKLPVRSEEQKN